MTPGKARRREALGKCLRQETAEWSRRTYPDLLQALADETHYERTYDGRKCQIEVQLLEHTAEYLQVAVSVDDGALLRSLKPLTTTFIVHRDGRIE